MVVKKLFKNVDYPDNIRDKRKIVDEYNKKMNVEINMDLSDKNPKMLFAFKLLIVLSIVGVFMYGNVSIILKLLYSLPTVAFIFYDFSLSFKSKKGNSNDKKSLYKRHISNLFIFVIIMYLALYLFLAVSLGRKFTTSLGFISWGMFMILSIATLLKAIKDAPNKFLNAYLNPDKKHHTQPSWALNITRILILLVCIFKPYLLLAGVVYVAVTPLIYMVVFSYYIYLQYDEVQNLLK